jgi:hypothetical protein
VTDPQSTQTQRKKERKKSLTAKAPQDPRGFVTLFVQRRGPECLAANLVRQPVDWSAQFVGPSPDLVKALFASGLGLVPGG